MQVNAQQITGALVLSNKNETLGKTWGSAAAEYAHFTIAAIIQSELWKIRSKHLPRKSYFSNKPLSLSILAIFLGLILSNCSGRNPASHNGSTICDAGQVELSNDALNCGACGKVCGTNQVCNMGSCTCAPGVPRVDGKCDASQVRTFDVVVGCGSTPEIVLLHTGSLNVLRSHIITQSVIAFGLIDDTLLVLDGAYGRLHTVRIGLNGSFEPSVWRTNLEPSTSNMVTDKDRAYIVGAGYSMLQVVQRQNKTFTDRNADAGTNYLDNERFRYGILGETLLGVGANALAIAQSSDALWVAYFGGFVREFALPFQSIVKFSIPDSNGSSTELKRFDLNKLDLQRFTGMNPLPRPSSMIVRNDIVYATLNNFDIDPLKRAPGGPGLLARIDSKTDAITTVSLGSKCLFPTQIAVAGRHLLVSCYGKANNAGVYESSGIALIDEDDRLIDFYETICQTKPSCTNNSPGPLVTIGNKVIVGLANDRAVLILSIEGTKLVAIRGIDNPLGVCSSTAPKQNYIKAIFAMP